MNSPFPKHCLHCGSEYVLLECRYTCGTFPGQPPTGHCLKRKRDALEQDNARLRAELDDLRADKLDGWWVSSEDHEKHVKRLASEAEALMGERDRARQEAEKLRDEVAHLKAMLHGTP